jgi:HEPN domain-containing protein
MGLPKPAEARLYYRAARQRFADAQLLLAAGRTTGAIYLAGYTVECSLKALIVANVAGAIRSQLLNEFRATRGHNIAWLGTLYRRYAKASVPKDVVRHLARVASWSTDLRYATGSAKSREADEFMQSVFAITTWADRRM